MVGWFPATPCNPSLARSLRAASVLTGHHLDVAAVKDALQRKGLLPQLQASVRSQIFNVLLDSEVSICFVSIITGEATASAYSLATCCAVVLVLQDSQRPEPCDETLLINELIREYLVWHGLRDTLSVFIPGVCSAADGGTAAELPAYT